jgi:hypothetical protein
MSDAKKRILTFPAARTRERLHVFAQMHGKRVSTEAADYLACVMGRVAEDLVLMSASHAGEGDKLKIEPRHVAETIGSPIVASVVKAPVMIYFPAVKEVKKTKKENGEASATQTVAE